MFDSFDGLFKSREKKEQEARDYAQWAFPYGDAQKEAVGTLLASLFPKLDESTRLFHYLTSKEIMGKSKEAYLDPATRDESIGKIASIMKRGGFQFLKPAERAAFCALAQLEWDVGPELNYPTAEAVKTLAKEFEEAFQKVKK